MKRPPASAPPKWAGRILAWYCKPELLEDLEGDLHEYYARNVSSRGRRMADFIYVIDVLKFFRLYTVRKPEFIQTLIHWIMLGSYIKTSGRNIVRNKLFSFINIFGLSVSMAVGLLIIATVYDVRQYDQFHKNHERIYRLTSNFQYLDQASADPFATTSLRAARAVSDDFTGIEEVAIFANRFSADMTQKETTVPLSGMYANDEVFKVFSFSLIEGNPATALTEPFSIVLTAKSALKLFGTTQVVGQQVIVDQERQYTVTGVMKDIPVFSHIRFDMLASLSTYEIITDDKEEMNNWENMWGTWAYVLVHPEADPGVLQRNLDELCTRENKLVEHTRISLSLYPVDEIMSGQNQSNQIGPVVGNTVIMVFSGLAFVVILSACFNYTNLSIARTLKRSKEVGIRKTIGALKSHVIFQFVVESVIISLLALAVAFGLFLYLRSHYIGIEHSFRELLVMNLSPFLIVLFVVFAVFVGIIAGVVPAFFFARLNAIQVLKNTSGVPRFKGLTLRKALITFQYTISIIAITATAIMYKQYRHFIAFDLGFTTENIVNIPLQGNKAELLRTEFSAMPDVKAIAQSSLIQSLGSYWGTNVKNPASPHDSATAFYNMVDEQYLPLHEYRLLAGRNFISSASDSASEREVIINEHLLRRFDFGGRDPQKAIGEVLLVDRKPLTIIGVVRDFHYGKPDNDRNTKEVMFRYKPQDAQYLNLKIASDDWVSTHSRLEAIWKKIDSTHPFVAKRYDEQIEESFEGLKAAMKVAGFLAFLVIGIASIGLLGMVVFTTETRLKEISIRKILGASERGLLLLLSKGFLFLLLIAAFIAVPVTYLFFTQVILQEIANTAPLSIVELFAGVLVVIVIAVLLIGSQTLKVSRTNPADVLKSE